jgi:hypothetical protein
LFPFETLRDRECFDADLGRIPPAGSRVFHPRLQQLEEPQLIPGSIPSPDCRSEIIRLKNQVAQNACPTHHSHPFPNRPPGIFAILEVIRFL